MLKRTWLIELRKSKQLTQEQVAASAYIDRGFYTQIETGTRNPSFHVAINIAKSLNFDPSLFFQDFVNEETNNPKDTPSYFNRMERGQVLYLYDRFENYLNYAVTFLLMGSEVGSHSILIDDHECLHQIQRELDNILKNVNEQKLIHLLNKNDFNFQTPIEILQHILSLESNIVEKSIRIWIQGNTALLANLAELLNLSKKLNFESNKILSVTSANAGTITARDHIKLMRNYPYLMTDHEIVYSPLYSNNKSIILPSLFVQENMD
ncbi:helix-turn-helix domain-containing protein [Ammoniphilus sp. CFH 90114]|uniref:helix-turn-helix domain-containing protein n=1 Tax=Ammoniphilus sp. CFH 90114 TaxID=2493665 RepID=UPI00100EBDE2|nr:helix-turn-helix transcriptional regulator [Ammoniphilus sp. CFH 90114]RXT03921.1 XRE family transcriptional regulator [Ammoniphilus sp. CFH 90114]